jgi:hypothetical protein
LFANENGKWEALNVSIGSSNDSGSAFDILLLLLNDEASSAMEKYFASPESEKIGMKVLPIGVRIIDRVRVFRDGR